MVESVRMAKGFNMDFLKNNGGEGVVEPVAGETLVANFPKDEHAYWDEGTIPVQWTRVESKTDDLNLGDNFVRADVPGLDVAPVQYVTGYAWTEFTMDRDPSCLASPYSQWDQSLVEWKTGCE